MSDKTKIPVTIWHNWHPITTHYVERFALLPVRTVEGWVWMCKYIQAGYGSFIVRYKNIENFMEFVNSQSEKSMNLIKKYKNDRLLNNPSRPVPSADYSIINKNRSTKISGDKSVEPDMTRIDRNYYIDDDSSSTSSSSSSRCDD